MRAAAVANLSTGLAVASHTGTAVGAFEALNIFSQEGVDASAFIWVHAQAEKDLNKHIEGARRGAWISLAGIYDKNIDAYKTLLVNMKENDLLSRVLISHDAGWYRPGETNGGTIRGYNTIFDRLMPALEQAGFTDAERDQLVCKNPAVAYAVKKRPAKNK